MNLVQLIELINVGLIRDYGFVARYASIEEYQVHSGVNVAMCAHANELIQAVFWSYNGKPEDITEG